MILCIGNILTPEELELIVSKVKTAEFIDGQATAGWHARLVKHNTQLPASSPVLAIRLWTNLKVKWAERYARKDNDGFNLKPRHYRHLHYAYSSHCI